MERKLTDYLARGLQVELDAAMERFHKLRKADRTEEFMTDMEDILGNMEFYKSQGVPLTDEYIAKAKLIINNLRGQMSV